MKWNDEYKSSRGIGRGVFLNAEVFKNGHGWYGRIVIRDLIKNTETVLIPPSDSFVEPRTAEAWCTRALTALIGELEKWKSQK